jgi:U3 small nucleolar RNA-associated protein 20
VLLPKLTLSQGLTGVGTKDSISLPQAWQDQIVTKFERLEVSPFPERGAIDKDPQTWRDRCLPKYSALLQILEVASAHPATNARIAELLLRKLKLALRPSSSLASDEVSFIVSQGFRSYLRMAKAGGSVDASLSPLLRAALPRFRRSIGFLESFLVYEEELSKNLSTERQSSDSSESSASEDDQVAKSLVANLSAPSHELRLASLIVLRYLDPMPEDSTCLSLMILIEETPLSLSSARTLGMHIRKLGQLYSTLPERSSLLEGVPAFLYGMLTVKLSPVWDDSLEALKVIGASKSGEDAIARIAFAWMDVPSQKWSGPPKPVGPTGGPRTDFDCTNFQRLEAAAGEVQKAIDHATDLMLQSFDESQQSVDVQPLNARYQATKVLTAVPKLAERHSRMIVPYLLSWNTELDQLEPSDEEEEQPIEKGWSLGDKRALLGVFAQFTNPKALFQSEKVYQALLDLMENGDVDVQKIVLKAILTWKQEGVKPYQVNLENLLDEARFKNELTVFLQGDDKVKPEHRADLMPVLLRLLYGRTVSKKGMNKGHGLQLTRLAVIRNLSMDDMGAFLDIASGPLKDVRVVDASGVREHVLAQEILPLRKQLGFLNMIQAIIPELGKNVIPFVDSIMHSILYCLFSSCRQLHGNVADGNDGDEESPKLDNESLVRSVRSSGLKCLIAIFQGASGFDWTLYAQAIVDEVVTPRVENLPEETSQGISSLLQLFSTWSQLPKAALILSINESLLPKIVDCVSGSKTKEIVKVFTLRIVRNLIKLANAPAADSEFNELIQTELLDPNSDHILKTVANLLETQSIDFTLLEACVDTIRELAPLVEKSENVPDILRISIYLLNQPPRRVNPKVKSRLLLILEQFIALKNEQEQQADRSAPSDDSIFETLASLFSYFKDRENRQSLCRVLHVVAGNDRSLEEVAHLCTSLNYYLENRIDEPDYDRRLAAFASISQKEGQAFTPRQWLPLIHNMLFFIRQSGEYGILSSNAADVLRRFIKDAALCQDQEAKERFEQCLKDLLMPAIHAGAREESNTVRREVLMVLGFLLAKMPSWPPVSDMQWLLKDVDEESSDPVFFFNILSPAVSRQFEALKLLQEANEKSEMSSQNLSKFFIPLLEHFIFGREDGVDDKGLGAQSADVIGNLALSLDWKHYRTTLQRYIGYIESKPNHLKQINRLLGRMVDALTASSQHKLSDKMEIDGMTSSKPNRQRLTKTIPGSERLGNDIVDLFLLSLVKHVHEKDESEVSYRVPVGVIIAKLLKLLPPEQMSTRLAGVLTDICHILRSKNLESRDMARDTLAKMSLILGPSCFGFVLKELRGALTRGYQLHVLSFTAHSLLLSVIPHFQQGEIDYCLPDVVAVIMDDTFGTAGQEKDAEGYITQMKEVKSSKSQDSMELIAKTASVNHLVELVKPLQALLLQKVDLRMVRKIDSLLTRITAGLLQNPAAESRDTLVFCYEVIQEVYNSQKPQAERHIDPKLKKYLLQKGAKRDGDRGRTTKYTHKLIRFAIDILRSILKKHDSLRNSANIVGFVPTVGDALVAGDEEVKEAVFKLLTVIVKVPFATDEGTGLYKVGVKEAMKSISMAPSTTSDLSQAALKLVSVSLRDRQDVMVKEAAVDMLLGKLKDDLTEPLYRHVTFNFLRSVLERKVQTATVYDTMDYVGTVMITNDDKDTRDLARGAFFQFLREYPMQKGRWTTQLNFIVANLKYDREGGRLSIMEIIHLLLMKSATSFTQEVAAATFLPLVFVVANDESERCQSAAAELIKEIFRQADKERMKTFLTLLRNWLEQDDNAAVLMLALQIFGFYFEAREHSTRDKKDLQLLLGKSRDVLGSGDIRLKDESLTKTTLAVISILLEKCPETILSPQCQDLWSSIRACLAHPEGFVKLSSVKLLSAYLVDFARNSQGAKAGDSLTGSHGLKLANVDVQDFVWLALGILRTPDVEEALATEVSQILVFFGPYLPASLSRDGPDSKEEDNDLEDAEDKDDGDDDDDEEDKQQHRTKDLQFLFWKLSSILRKMAPAKAAAMVPKVAAMDVFESLCKRVPQEHLALSFRTVLRPLHQLTDPSVPMPNSLDELFKTRYEAVKTRATILMDVLQKKFGTAAYTKELLTIREEVKDRRVERNAKRKIDAVADPQRYGRFKQRKLEKKKERRKVRGQEYRVMRQAYKGW